MDRSLTMARRLHGNDDPLTSVRLNNLSGIVFDLGEKDRGLALIREGIDILSKNRRFKRKYAVEMGKMYSNLGRMQLQVKDILGARSNLSLAYSIHERELGPRHFSTAIDLNNIGTVERDEGNYPAAYRNFTKAVEIHRGALEPVDYRLAIALYNVATAAFNLGRFAEAETCLRESVAINEIVYQGTDHYEFIASLDGLARVLDARKNHLEAITYYDRAIELATNNYGRSNLATLQLIEGRGSAAFALICPLIAAVPPKADATGLLVGPDYLRHPRITSVTLHEGSLNVGIYASSTREHRWTDGSLVRFVLRVMGSIGTPDLPPALVQREG